VVIPASKNNYIFSCKRVSATPWARSGAVPTARLYVRLPTAQWQGVLTLVDRPKQTEHRKCSRFRQPQPLSHHSTVPSVCVMSADKVCGRSAPLRWHHCQCDCHWQFDVRPAVVPTTHFSRQTAACKKDITHKTKGCGHMLCEHMSLFYCVRLATKMFTSNIESLRVV
jgi:hypothetical protein